MKVLSLDISSKNTGWSILVDKLLVDFGEFGDDKPSIDKNAHADRLLRFQSLVRELILKHSPDVIIIEDAWAGKNITTLKILCFYHGIVHALAAEYNLKEVVFMPSRFRRLVGVTHNIKLNHKDREENKAAAIAFAYNHFTELFKNSASEDICESAILGLAHFYWDEAYNKMLLETKAKNPKTKSKVKLHDLANKATEKFFDEKVKENEKSP
mgnify:CR=1 FL=1